MLSSIMPPEFSTNPMVATFLLAAMLLQAVSIYHKAPSLQRARIRLIERAAINCLLAMAVGVSYGRPSMMDFVIALGIFAIVEFVFDQVREERLPAPCPVTTRS
jgi:hypothetical protein